MRNGDGRLGIIGHGERRSVTVMQRYWTFLQWSVMVEYVGSRNGNANGNKNLTNEQMCSECVTLGIELINNYKLLIVKITDRLT